MTNNKNKLKMLCIEDNRADAFLLEEMLHEHYGKNMRMRWEGALSDGLQRLTESHFDIIFLDLGLGESHGLDTLNSVTSVVDNTPIIVISGLDDKDVASAVMKSGAKGYFVKGTFNEFTLKEMVEQVLQKYQHSTHDSTQDYYRHLLNQLNINSDLKTPEPLLEAEYDAAYESFVHHSSNLEPLQISDSLQHSLNNIVRHASEKKITVQDLINLHKAVIQQNKFNTVKHGKANEFLLIILILLNHHTSS